MATKIVVVGMGYVGIPCAALLAEVDGFDVTGLQRRSKRSGWKIEALNNGESPFEGNEPGLAELIARVVAKGSFKVTDDVDVLSDADIILIDVQTPTDEQHMPQYLSLREVCVNIGKRMKKGVMVIVESTVAPGTTSNVVQKIIELESGMKGGEDFDLVFSYERVMPGKLIRNIVHLPRVIGGISAKSAERAREMYSKIVRANIRVTDVLTAELSKTIENAYRDVNIAFANEMALVSESLGVNVYEIRELVNELPSRNMHIPGAGVGGHCLPKDPWLLRHGLYEYGSWKVEPEIISLSRRINNHMPIHMSYLVENALKARGRSLQGATVTILGAAYLENSDDTRNTPAAALVGALIAKGAEVRIHDPYVRDWDFGPHEILNDLQEAAKDSDCLALVTKHEDYLSLDLSDLKKVMRTPTVVDGRNVFDTDAVRKKGFEYRSVGKVGLQRK
ncbi:MAG: nucleotide sugar dehydrogenase [Candidatus Thorarchaeota archaeon]|jgi:UDP-N-acetyl-D-mannosaminuronic acid dehydrogenase